MERDRTPPVVPKTGGVPVSLEAFLNSRPVARTGKSHRV
jgi:hypothetical protein